MGWYVCCDCGHIFEDGEFVVKKEDFGGRRCYCPSCGSDCWEEGRSCKKCLGVFSVEDLTNGLCKECLDDIAQKYKYDIKGCYSLSRKNNAKEDVSVDAFLSSVFTEEQINELLYRELVLASAISPIDCTAFIEADRSWFDDKVTRGGDN